MRHRIVAVLGVVALALPALLVGSPAHAADLVESEPNDHWTTADALPLGTTVRGSAYGTRAFDTDVFVTTLAQDSRVVPRLTFPAGFVGGAYTVTVLDANQREHGTWSLEGGDHAGAWADRQALFLPAGKVYVRVEATQTSAAWSAQYALRVEATPGFVETEANDHWTTADPLPLGTTIRSSAYGTRAFDTDVFVTTLAQDSRVVPRLTFPAGLVGGAYTVTVQDESRRDRGTWSLEGGDHAGAWADRQSVFLPAGKVYVTVEATRTSAVWGTEYALRVEATPGFVETEPNDHWTTADSLPIGTTVRGSAYATASQDYDYYTTSVTAQTRLRVGLTFPHGRTGEAYWVGVYDTSRRLVAERQLTAKDSAGAWASSALVTVPRGDVYVAVGARSTAAVWGDEYRLTLSRVVSSATPRVTGSAKVGATLRAVPGTWTSGTRFTYQWLRAGKVIKGATARTYKVAKADAGRALTVRVTGTRSGYVAASATSAKKTVAKYTPKVTAKKLTVTRGAKGRLTVVVKTSATARPTGTVTVKVAGKTVRAKVSAKSKGKVKVTLPKVTRRGTYKVSVKFSPSGATKTSTKARTVTTTLKVR